MTCTKSDNYSVLVVWFAVATDGSEFILQQIKRFSYFPYVEKRLACDVVLDNGHLLRRGQRLQFDLHGLNQNDHDDPGHNYTWGFGRRRCPGAQAGRYIVAHAVFSVLSKYKLSPATSLRFPARRCDDYAPSWSWALQMLRLRWSGERGARVRYTEII
eukprot:SAG22_NODE_798_length_7130_cov_4.576732_2_plen_158_part_00